MPRSKGGKDIPMSTQNINVPNSTSGGYGLNISRSGPKAIQVNDSHGSSAEKASREATSSLKNSRLEKTSFSNIKELEEALGKMEKELGPIRTKISFHLDPESGEPIVQIVDKETNKVLRQVPPEELLKIRKSFKELMKGVLMDARV